MRRLEHSEHHGAASEPVGSRVGSHVPTHLDIMDSPQGTRIIRSVVSLQAKPYITRSQPSVVENCPPLVREMSTFVNQLKPSGCLRETAEFKDCNSKLQDQLLVGLGGASQGSQEEQEWPDTHIFLQESLRQSRAFEALCDISEIRLWTIIGEPELLIGRHSPYTLGEESIPRAVRTAPVTKDLR
jgi:hypothetical protein